MAAPPPPPLPPTPLLVAFLDDRDEPCPSCGYSLRRLLAARCPECHRELRLTVGLTEPRMGLWVTALVGMSFGVGFNVLLLVYLLVQILRSEMPTQSTGARLLLKHNAVGLLVQGLGLAALIVWGRRLRRWSVPARLLLCLAAAALTAANVIIFSFTIR